LTQWDTPRIAAVSYLCRDEKWMVRIGPARQKFLATTIRAQ